MNNDYDPTKYVYPPSHIQVETAIATAMNRCKSYGFNSTPCLAANKKANQLSQDYVNYYKVTNEPHDQYDVKTEIPTLVEYYTPEESKSNPLKSLVLQYKEEIKKTKHELLIKLVLLIVVIVVICLIIYHLMTSKKYHEI